MGRFLLIVFLLANAGLAGGAVSSPGLVYAPEGDAIVLRNGARWHNRPLYLNERHPLVWGGEMPGLKGPPGELLVAFRRGEHSVPLHQFAERTMRYRPGRLEWELSDPRFPGLRVQFIGTTLADATGYTAQLVAQGTQSGDRVLWCMFPPGVDGHAAYRAAVQGAGFRLDRNPAQRLTALAGRVSGAVVWEQLDFALRDTPDRSTGLGADLRAGAGLVAVVPIENGRARHMAIACDENDGQPIKPRARELDPAAVADAAKAFADGYRRVQRLGDSVRVDTPDPYLNAGVGASVAASYGLFVNDSFVHGGSAWRFQIPGWRTMGGAVAYEWIDQVRRVVATYDAMQVKQDAVKTGAVFSANGCQQAGDSRFFGAGFVQYHMSPHYEFQTQFFDDAIRAWRWTADPELEKRLLPMLELHLERCKACFDPDGDDLYESYNNTWPNDSIWFNGGGTPEQSAYVYQGFRAAADLRRRAGDPARAARHDAEAEKIRKAVNARLWLADRGHFASYIESGGLHRAMPDAWAYAQFVPMETGLATPQQAWGAMFYTEWALERFPMPFGGEMRHTANFVPGQWSIRELYHGDNFAMALGCFLAGQGDDGWALLRGTMLQTMYGDERKIDGFSSESGQYGRVNYISPGGLSQPNCGIDFNDIASPFARAVVEGLFGYRPDYPNRVVTFAPAFPTAWNRAAIRTPGFSLAFDREAGRDLYRTTLTRPAAARFQVPVLAEKVDRVTLNGRDVPWRIEPWAGYGMLVVEAPAGATHELVVTVSGRRAVVPAAEAVEHDGAPGSRLRLDLQEGAVPHYWLTKVRVPAREEPRLLQQAPADAAWRHVDLSAVLNGDIQTIFKQEYRSPRPGTCSMRIGYDGWSAWTFTHWGIPAPEVRLDGAATPGGPIYELPREATAGLSDAFTIEAWLRPGRIPAEGARIVDWTTPNTLDGFLLDTYPGNSLRLITANGEVTARDALTPGKAVHVAGVYDRAGRSMRLYVDGREVAARTTGSFPPLIPIARGALVGASSAAGSERFVGEISRVALYRRALTATEIESRARGASAPVAQADWTLRPDAPPPGVRRLDASPTSANVELRTASHASFARPGSDRNVAFTSLWDNWPKSVTVPVDAAGEAVWLLVCGSTTPMQARIANGVLRFRYADGVVETLELVPPLNYWSLCGFGRMDYDYGRDGFVLPKEPPPQVQLGKNCRAMVYGWKLRPGVALRDVTLETLSQEVVIGLMGVSVMNPRK